MDKRNKKVLDLLDINEDYLYKIILEIAPKEINSKVLEIGCGNGKRLVALKESGYIVYGIDPSNAAIEDAVSNGVIGSIGTADNLPFEDNNFDIVIYF